MDVPSDRRRVERRQAEVKKEAVLCSIPAP